MADRDIYISIRDDEINKIADHIPPDNLYELAVEYLELLRPEVLTHIKNAGDNCKRATQECLYSWRNRHSGQVSRKLLSQALRKAAKEKGLLPADCADFLSDSPHADSVDWNDIQQWNKESFQHPPFTLATTKEWSSHPSKSKLKDIYTSLKWVHIKRRPVDTTKEPLDDYWELLSHEDLQNGGHFRILVQGDAGIGKTTVVHVMAMEWANGQRDILKEYDFVFVIPMRDVKGNETLEELILANHKGLSGNSCPNNVITTLLSENRHRVLVIFDGYDEYTPGTNKYIDTAIEKRTLWNSSMLMTSRSCEKLLPVRDYIDAEAQILGFSDKNVMVFVEKFIGKEKVRDFMAQAKKRGITDLLNIPILLQMLCELYVSRKKLPSSRSGIVGAIVELCFEREKNRLGKSWKFADIKHYLVKLGKLAWMGLNKNTQQLLLNKKIVEDEVGVEALQLGLLMGGEDSDNSAESQWVSFHHKMIQEYVAALYLVAERLETNGNQVKTELCKLRQIFDHKVVLQFCCGLSVKAGEVLIEHCTRVISDSMMDRVEHSQGPFEVTWLPDNRAHIVGTNQIIEPSVVMNWPDTVTYYLDSITTLLKYMKSECQMADIDPFSNRNLYMLSEYELPKLHKVPPNLCIAYKITDKHDFPVDDRDASFEIEAESKGLMIIKPNFNNNEKTVLESLVNLVKYLKSLAYLFVCNFVYANNDNESMHNFARTVVCRKTFKYITIVRSKLPCIFYTHLFTYLPMYVNLEKLDLSYSVVPDYSAQHLAQNLPKMITLRCLVLRECQLSDNTCHAVCRSLVHLVNLKILDLSNNPIGRHAEHMVTAIEKQMSDGLEVKLWGLYLKGCKIANDIMKRLMKAWGKCPNIDRMTLIDNDMQDIIGSLMSPPPPKLKGLYLQAGRITGQDVQAICRALLSKKLPYLHRLHLNINTLRDEDVRPLIEILDNDTEREEFCLNLSDNLITDELMNERSDTTRDGLHIIWRSNLPQSRKFKQT